LFEAWNWRTNREEGGTERVETGRIRGTVPPLLRKGWTAISSKVGRFKGSGLKIFVIRSLAASEMGALSGKV